ncbi:MAG: ATP-dependent zinc metalloprotease FtsH [Verrucomicrobia bacterium]|nr:ATP-dependent zinc metalloprotease FtsH [Verrucomicrobiota bacterium]
MEPTKKTPENPPQPGSRMPFRGMAVWFLFLAILLFVFQMFSNGPERISKIPYNPDFLQMLEEGKIRKAEIVMEVTGSRFVRGELVETDAKTGQHKKFRVFIASTEDVQRLLTEKGIAFEVVPQNPYLWQILSGAIPFILVMGLLYFLFMRQMRMAGKGAMSFGKSRAKLLSRGKNRITFSDVAGVEEAEEEVQEIVEFLKDPKRYQKLGGRIPKGVLLVGPPGTGKTLLAKAIAGEANVPFFSISGSDFVEMFVGVGASRVRDMFEQARKNAPCIIFIDEIDAVGRSRFSGIGGGHDEREQTLNALLVEMDGFDTQEGIIIIAATNRPDVLDNALLRPGRFDRQIAVDLPSLEGREAILKIHTKRIKLTKDLDLRRIARGTPGFSGADLSNLVNEAALLAARRSAEAVELQDMEEARDKVRWGRERRSRLLDDQEKNLTAYHEAGHAIVLALAEEGEPLHKVTIIPRGQALGATMQLPEKDRYTQGRRKLLGMLVGLMGGRAAEELACSDITTGAQNDLKQATRLARMMVCEWGMSAELGPQAFGDREEVLFLGREVSRNQDYSEATAQRIDQEVNRMLRDAYAQAIHILQTHRDKLDLIARLLIERETLDGVEVEELLEHGRLLSKSERGDSDATPTAPAPLPVAQRAPEPPVIPPDARTSPA